ncbi:transposase family protein [Streptomyces sp. NPDC046876]|uniref:transposase family protein n=1 Tax=Streptomyces sp. NPDC046876 TaxID=3155616 RepID=UPI0033C52A19
MYMPGQEAVTCPSCGVSASRVHSTYRQRRADRPIGGRRVVLRLMVRRFFCDNAACERRTPGEQVEHLTALAPHQRRTVGVARTVRAIGLAVGGRAGGRLVGYLPVRASRDVIVREVRRLPAPPYGQGRSVGDRPVRPPQGRYLRHCARRRETRRPIDLLPDAPRTRWPPGSPTIPASR